ncbi:MAG TPA: RNA helicase [Verrucomicrobia bacterium]|nr:MAG: RNA helicase [Lentisphaerae bacterium GWF2_57_35]HBA82531.1 RNA helicase [Verrucomicrobiota bacterium]
MSFESFEFDSAIASNLAALGFTTPTPIQRKTMGPILQRRDLMGLAQTGTGKTAAYALPVLQLLLKGPRHHARALVVVPTRELADQVYDVFSKLGEKTGLYHCSIYGGVNISPQIQKLKRGPEIIIACPGRLLDHLGRRSANLAKTEILVLDEADRMFDMGFLPDIKKILKFLPKERQTLLFSATMPDDIRKLAHEILVNPLTVQIEHSTPPATVTHALYPVAHQQHKTPLTLALLKHIDRESVLIFTRTKRRTEKLAKQLSGAGHKVTSLQGNLSQNKRKSAMEGFRDGTYHIMVATDIASRGLDVSSISHVINYDIPNHEDDYIHRIGRTGRAAKTGDAFTLIVPEDEVMVRSIERRLHARLERRTLEGFDYKAEIRLPQAHHGHRPQATPANQARRSFGSRRSRSSR